MGPKSSVQTIVMHHSGSKYGQIRVKKRSFLLKKLSNRLFFSLFEFSSWRRFQRALIDLSSSDKNSSCGQFAEMTSNNHFLTQIWPKFDHNLTINRSKFWSNYFFLSCIGKSSWRRFRGALIAPSNSVQTWFRVTSQSSSV